MLYEGARNVAHCALWKNRPLLAKTLGSRYTMESMRFIFRQIRDEIHQACIQFEDSDGSEEFEELYLPLFDALSFLTQATEQPQVDQACVRAALDHLNDLAELLGQGSLTTQGVSS